MTGPLDPAPHDDADPLARFRDRFAPAPGLVAYLDGNSLGRPPAATAERLARFVREDWGTRLIRGWDEGWWTRPEDLGDRLGALALGAAPGQTVVADSTTVLLYKLARAAVALRPGHDEIVTDAGDFPTDRDLLAGIAAERGLRLRRIDTDPAGGITPEEVSAAVSERTALVSLSHVAYRSGRIADVAAITRIAHDAGALVLWDLSHSAGSVPVELDAWGADLAAGCGYKYLNGGPGAPAFGYARAGLLPGIENPVRGWVGRAEPFAMDAEFAPDPGIRRLLSGTPPVLATVPLQVSLEMLAEAGTGAVREKSLRLTSYVLDLADAWLEPLGVTVASPRDPRHRGGHVMLTRPGFAGLLAPLHAAGVIPYFREPDGLRIGPAPLSTSFAEVHAGMAVLRDMIAREPGSAPGSGRTAPVDHRT
ncbi:Kynureninase [Pseudonocardia sp. Ae168_Ps1]|uniref:kynureninase n=1 Tax=unclassified Pseudonocardia TaxID=2619320 RepID=UPI00094B44DC|nr:MULTISPECIES: aminotransferase class V-fold PLP-dependent enzyme [unclassified Pseudonocardia]OLL76221.1 Kynureninase [Pseudonocardia sp. Ae150A_Ps1]OLL82220.1 Kynureninase [Pseudonocardia sp. Ae168_Ps1]OLL83664.1 Kynureninase [Pseudonocardia sp. Ae263_Ps1]OLL90295.1 Kynureninase [Pseudonocardia sp. Ae356_Ps1]